MRRVATPRRRRGLYGGSVSYCVVLGLLILFAVAYALLIAIGTAGVLWQMNRPRRKTLAVSLGKGGPGDPADLGLEGEEVTFNLSDGSKSPGWIVGGDRSDGPIALVIHGHRDSRFGSLYRAQMLRPYVAATAVFDLPGCGDAEAPRCLMGQREADDVFAVIHGLPPELIEGKPIVLLGYSMGATIALKAAAPPEASPEAPPEADREHPTAPRDSPRQVAEVAGVIACAPYRLWDEGLRGQFAKRRLPAWPIVPLVGLMMRLFPWFGERPGFDRAQDAAAFAGPVLVLHGDADQICPLDAGRRIAEAAPAGELVVIPGGTHNQLLGADYDAVHGALSAFFGRVQASGGKKTAGPRGSSGIMERSPKPADRLDDPATEPIS